MFEQAFKNIDDVLWKDAGRNGDEELAHCSPQDIMDEIAALDAESAEVLARIRSLL